jgi:bifunctional non-homologous end joining protein LigD
VSSRLPVIRTPMLATLIDHPFEGDEWSFEIKWDGVRAVTTVTRSSRPRMTSRNGRDLLAQFPEFADLQRSFPVAPVILDGEIVSLDRYGRSSFQRLQPRLNRRTSDPQLERRIPATYVVFDLLFEGRKDLRDRPLEERRERLTRLLAGGIPHLMLSKHIDVHGKRLFALAKRRHLEGIVAKRRDSPYVEGRSRLWLKIKTHHEQEVVIAGWTEPRGSRKGFGALIMGVYEKGKLVYVGHVGTGFDQAGIRDLMRRLRGLHTSRCPFAVPPPSPAPAHWVRPRLVAEVKFSEWTADGLMRQPVFVGLRHDKDPRDVVRE